jgi:hypothetical protein
MAAIMLKDGLGFVGAEPRRELHFLHLLEPVVAAIQPLDPECLARLDLIHLPDLRAKHHPAFGRDGGLIEEIEHDDQGPWFRVGAVEVFVEMVIPSRTEVAVAGETVEIGFRKSLALMLGPRARALSRSSSPPRRLERFIRNSLAVRMSILR